MLYQGKNGPCRFVISVVESFGRFLKYSMVEKEHQREDLSVLHVVCPLVIPRGMPGEDLSVLHVVCPLVTPRRVPEEDLSVCLSPRSVLLFLRP